MDYSILVLEDDEELLRVLVEVLGDEGFDVDGCANSDKAIDLSKSKSYDLMIADIRMTGLDGLSALSQVQSYSPQMDALAITGYADPEQARRASRLGIKALLKKPFELDELLQKVADILRDRAKSLERSQAFERLLSAASWSTTQLSIVLDETTQTPYQFSKLVKLTNFLCSSMSILRATAERVALAALIAAWTQCRPKIPFPLQTELPLEHKDWLGQLQEWWNGQGPKGLKNHEITLPSRIVVLALAMSREDADLATLEAKWPGRFDPHLLEIAARHFPEPESHEDKDGEAPEDQSRLRMAATLLQTGELERASTVLSSVINAGVDSFDGVQASLLLARVRLRGGAQDEAKSIARRVPEVAAAYGPLLCAKALVESGKILFELGEALEAKQFFEQAGSSFRTLNLPAHQAEALVLERLASGNFFHDNSVTKPLFYLFDPQRRDRGRGLVKVIFSEALKDGNPPEWGRVLVQRLYRAFPSQLHSVLARASAEQREQGQELFGLSLETTPDANEAASDHLAASDMEISCLGGLNIVIQGQTVGPRSWRTNKAKLLFCRILEAAPSVVSEDVLVDEFWPSDVEKGKRSLYTATSHIRVALRPYLGEEKNVVLRTPAGLLLNPDLKISYDVAVLREHFKKLQTSLESENFDEALPQAREAASLGERPYLPGCYLDWAIRIREDLERQLVVACVLVARHCYINRAYFEAVEFSKRALSIDPLHELAVAVLVDSLVETGRPAEAVRQFSIHDDELRKQLDLDETASFDQLREVAQALRD